MPRKSAHSATTSTASTSWRIRGSWLIYDFLPHIWAAGADILSEDGRQATVDTPALRETFAAYRDMWSAGAVHPTSRSGNGNNAVEAFASGKVGVLMTGSYIVNLLTSKYPDVKFAVAPIPGAKGGQSSFAGGDSLALIKGVSEEKKKVLLDFVNFYMEPEQQVFITKESGMPSRTDLAEQAYAQFDKRNLVAYDVLTKARTPYTFSSDETLRQPHRSVPEPHPGSGLRRRRRCGDHQGAGRIHQDP